MEKDTIRALLEEELNTQFENLKELEFGSVAYDKAVDDLAKLYKLKMEEDGKNKELNLKKEQQHIEHSIKYDDLLKNLKLDYFKLGVEIAGIILPLAFYASWMKKGFKFEESGTFTSTTFRGLFQKFKTTK